MARTLKNIAAAFACALLLALPAGGVFAQNLLVNGGFEGGTTGWTVLGNTPVTDGGGGCAISYEGSHFLWMAYMPSLGMSSYYSQLRQTVPFTAGHTAVLSARMMHCSNFPLTGTAAGIGQVLTCDVAFLDASGTPIYGWVMNGNSTIDGTSPRDAWQTIASTQVAPPGTTQVRVRVQYSTVNWVQSAAMVDAVELQDQQAVADEPAAWSAVKAMYR